VYESNLDSASASPDPCGNNPTPAQRENCAADGVPGGSYVQGQFDAYAMVVGGNRELQPEEGDSASAGFTFAPSRLPGTSLSLDWWRTELDDVITLSPDPALLLQGCANYGAAEACRRIERYPDGSIELLDARHFNAASLASEGYDLDLGYASTLGPGTLDARLMVTWLARHDLQSFAESDPVDTSGVRYSFQAYPEWRGLGYVAYSAERWSSSWQAQYVGAVEECLVNPFAPADAFQGCRTIDAAWYHDLQFTYRIGWGLEMALGVNNVMDEDPPRVNFDAAANTDPATYRLLGRTYFASLSYRLE
jgi:outer membrane receptor protein involved in Fe transport